MMISIKNIASPLAMMGFVFLLSCNGQLDIEPEQNISSEVALSTDLGVKNALIGTYDLLSHGEVWGGGVALSSEIYGDVGNLIFSGGAARTEMQNKSLTEGNDVVLSFWANAYRAINMSNAVIEAVGVVNAEDRNSVEAEAKFIRAACYFELVNMFGKTWTDGDPNSNLGVPLVISSTRSLSDLEVPRATVSAIYNQIISDLEYARDNLPDANHPQADTYAASGLLARVYLVQGNFSAANTEANRVIESTSFALLPDLNDVFNQPDKTDEDIFSLEVTSQDGANSQAAAYTSQDFGGDGVINITGDHLAIYDTIDQRGQFFHLDNDSLTRTNKWKIRNDREGNVNIIRLSEMYLTRAESRFQQGDIPGALEDINVIRERAGVSPYLIEDLTIDVILEERYRELCFEGHLFRDLKRTARNFGQIPFNDNRMVFPIPQAELDVNSLLIQNPGY